jgi:hypothetical protein
MSTEPETSPLNPAAPAALEWTAHPVKRRPLLSAAVTLFILLLAILVQTMTSSTLFGVLALVVLMASLTKFYFPTSYKLGDRHVIVKTTLQTLTKDWSIYRSCYPDRNGILLSPFPEPSRLENFRGLYLMFSENKDEVTAFVKAHIGQKAFAAQGAQTANPEGDR